MNRFAQIIFSTTMFLFVLTGCATVNEQLGLADQSKPIIYDTSVPAEQTSTVAAFMSLTIKKFNGKSVSWNRRAIIPAGEHEFVVDYKWDKPLGGNKVERQTRDGIVVRYKFIPGHNYTMLAKTDERTQTVGVIVRDDTVVAQERKADDARVEANFKAILPEETTKPTRLEGTWKVPKDQGTRFSYMIFKGNTWEYSPGYNDSDAKRGRFIIKDDSIKLFLLSEQQNGNWVQNNDYYNAVSEYRFVFEADGGFRLLTIKGFAKQGTFYKVTTP